MKDLTWKLIALLAVAGLIATRFTLDSPAGQLAYNPASQAVVGARIHSLRFDATPLNEALAQLCELTHANMDIRWTELESAGIERTRPVTVQIYDLPLQRALRLVLNDAGGTVRLGFRFHADEQVFRVTTLEQLSGDVVVRLYDVHDLIPGIAPRLHYGPLPPGQSAAQHAMDALREAISISIAPDSWRDNGGASGNMLALGGWLIVVATPENHAQVSLLLHNFRQMLNSGDQSPSDSGVNLLDGVPPEVDFPQPARPPTQSGAGGPIKRGGGGGL